MLAGVSMLNFVNPQVAVRSFLIKNISRYRGRFHIVFGGHAIRFDNFSFLINAHIDFYIVFCNAPDISISSAHDFLPCDIKPRDIAHIAVPRGYEINFIFFPLGYKIYFPFVTHVSAIFRYLL